MVLISHWYGGPDGPSLLVAMVVVIAVRFRYVIDRDLQIVDAPASLTSLTPAILTPL